MKTVTVAGALVACAAVVLGVLAYPNAGSGTTPLRKAYVKMAAYAAMAAEPQAPPDPTRTPLSPQADLPAIDRYLADPEWLGPLYAHGCREILDGPPVYRIVAPRLRGSRTILGFTGEIRFERGLPWTTFRSVIYWEEDLPDEQRFLRIDSCQALEFDRIMTNHGIDPSRAELFPFPALRQAVASKGAPPSHR